MGGCKGGWDYCSEISPFEDAWRVGIAHGCAARRFRAFPALVARQAHVSVWGNTLISFALHFSICFVWACILLSFILHFHFISFYFPLSADFRYPFSPLSACSRNELGSVAFHFQHWLGLSREQDARTQANWVFLYPLLCSCEFS